MTKVLGIKQGTRLEVEVQGNELGLTPFSHEERKQIKREKRSSLRTKKRIDYYLSLPYKYALYPAEEGGYIAEMPDLSGCITQANTENEALAMIEDAKRGMD